MSKNLFITATEDLSGKSLVALSVMEILLRKIDKVGFFRPIINADASPDGIDRDIRLISEYFNLDLTYEEMYGFTMAEVSALLADGKQETIIEGVIEKYNKLQNKCDFVLCEGIDTSDFIKAYEFDINAEICRNLAAPVFLVVNGYQKDVNEILHAAEMALDSLKEKKCSVIATAVNRITSCASSDIFEAFEKSNITQGKLVYALRSNDFIDKPTMKEVVQFLDADVLYGETMLSNHVHHFTVAAMQLSNFVNCIEQGALIITPGDRADVVVGCLASLSSRNLDQISGIILTGGLIPEASIRKLIEGFSNTIPILSVPKNTFETAMAVNNIHAKISPDDTKKISYALSLFEKYVDVEQLQKTIITQDSTIITPKMFEYKLIENAKKHKQHIVLPEGEEDRILISADILLQREVVDLTLLGNEEIIRNKASSLGLNLEQANIVDPVSSPLLDEYIKTYCELRKHKGIIYKTAYDNMSDVTFFGTMMVRKGHADAMVSGAVHSTASTIRPAFQIIKNKPGFSIVSSVFFMCFTDRILVYGDCAVNVNPNAQQLAEIGVNAALTSRAFGIEPVVAFLSYSSGSSGQGEDVEKVCEAVEIAKEKAKEYFDDLKIEGPLQYDAAVDLETAKIKMPDSEVAGKATVFIFPDLNTGNNTYKAVQRSADIVAVGPVLQGLNHPVNDLSRGCTVPDIINTVAITAIQAQVNKGLK